jgi:hypothetical protein
MEFQFHERTFQFADNGEAKILYLFLKETIIYGFLGGKGTGGRGPQKGDLLSFCEDW